MSRTDDLPEVDGYRPIHVYISAIVGVVVALGLIWVASGFNVFYEELPRVGPTWGDANAGVGADWVAGNTIPWLDAVVALTHAADVIMGAFILVMVFLHWAAFHRLAGQMRQPGEPEQAVAADGGTTPEDDAAPADEPDGASADADGGDRP